MARSGKVIADMLRCGIVAVAVLCFPAAGHALSPDEPVAEAATKQAEYEAVAREIELSAERVEKLAAEIAGVKKDYMPPSPPR